MQFYSFCFSLWFSAGIRIYDNFEEYLRGFADISEAISGGSIDTYKFKAENEGKALEKAKQYYKDNGWKIE